MVARRPSGLSRHPSSPSLDSTPQVVVPKLNKDPIQSLRPWPVEVTFAGQDFEIPAVAATGWLVYLMQPEPDLDGLIADLLPGIEDLAFDLELPINDLYLFCLEIIACVSARHWWVALRLISVARTSWHILGPELMFRMDPNKVSLAAWLDAVLVLTLKNMDPKETTMFTMRLEAIPAGFVAEEVEPEMSQDAFLSMS